MNTESAHSNMCKQENACSPTCSFWCPASLCHSQEPCTTRPAMMRLEQCTLCKPDWMSLALSMAVSCNQPELCSNMLAGGSDLCHWYSSCLGSFLGLPQPAVSPVAGGSHCWLFPLWPTDADWAVWGGGGQPLSCGCLTRLPRLDLLPRSGTVPPVLCSTTSYLNVCHAASVALSYQDSGCCLVPVIRLAQQQ